MILNSTDVPGLKTVYCNYIIADYLYKKGLVILNINNGKYYFAITEYFEEVYKKLPFFLKWFIHKTPS